MKILSPYKNEGRWMRGTLHVHSAFSPCAFHNINELALAYRDYDFLAISDHDRITTETERLGVGCLLRAVEVSGSHHMLLVNEGPPVEEPIDSSFTPERYGELARRVVAEGGIAVANHPVRRFGQYWEEEEVRRAEGLTGLEIFSGDGIHVEQDVGMDLWDGLLTEGVRLWGFGNDDFHHWGQERRVWNVVNAKTGSPRDVLDALRTGDFYVSSGFGFDAITAEQGAINYKLLSVAPGFANAYKYLTLYGSGGRVLAEKTGRFTEYSYTPKGDEGYVRCEVYMAGGYCGISQPIFIEI